MMKRLLILLVGLVLVGGFGCKKDDPPPKDVKVDPNTKLPELKPPKLPPPPKPGEKPS